jgi:hypothetical protein
VATDTEVELKPEPTSTRSQPGKHHASSAGRIYPCGKATMYRIDGILDPAETYVDRMTLTYRPYPCRILTTQGLPWDETARHSTLHVVHWNLMTRSISSIDPEASSRLLICTNRAPCQACDCSPITTLSTGLSAFHWRQAECHRV